MSFKTDAYKQPVSLEVARFLKSVGYDKACLAYYRKLLGSNDQYIYHYDNTYHRLETNKSLDNSPYDYHVAPTWQEVADWIKDKYDINIFNKFKPKMIKSSSTDMVGHVMDSSTDPLYVNKNEYNIIGRQLFLKAEVLRVLRMLQKKQKAVSEKYLGNGSVYLDTSMFVKEYESIKL